LITAFKPAKVCKLPGKLGAGSNPLPTTGKPLLRKGVLTELQLSARRVSVTLCRFSDTRIALAIRRFSRRKVALYTACGENPGGLGALR
jgi:hypothetical protein